MCTNIDTAHFRPFLGRAWKALTSRWYDDSAWLEAKKGSPVHSAPGSPDYVRRPNKIASKKTGHDDDVPALVSFAHVIASPHMCGLACTCHCTCRWCRLHMSLQAHTCARALTHTALLPPHTSCVSHTHHTASLSLSPSRTQVHGPRRVATKITMDKDGENAITSKQQIERDQRQEVLNWFLSRYAITGKSEDMVPCEDLFKAFKKSNKKTIIERRVFERMILNHGIPKKQKKNVYHFVGIRYGLRDDTAPDRVVGLDEPLCEHQNVRSRCPHCKSPFASSVLSPKRKGSILKTGTPRNTTAGGRGAGGTRNTAQYPARKLSSPPRSPQRGKNSPALTGSAPASPIGSPDSQMNSPRRKNFRIYPDTQDISSQGGFGSLRGAQDPQSPVRTKMTMMGRRDTESFEDNEPEINPFGQGPVPPHGNLVASREARSKEARDKDNKLEAAEFGGPEEAISRMSSGGTFSRLSSGRGFIGGLLDKIRGFAGTPRAPAISLGTPTLGFTRVASGKSASSQSHEHQVCAGSADYVQICVCVCACACVCVCVCEYVYMLRMRTRCTV